METGSPGDISSSSEQFYSSCASGSDRHRRSALRRRRGHHAEMVVSQREYLDRRCRHNERRENGRIDKLTEDLYDASRAIHCNKQMLREMKHHSRDQQKDMAQLKYDLEQSRRKLGEERERRREAESEDRVQCRSVHFSECPEKWKTDHLAAQLEAERTERTKVESERAQVIGILNSSLKMKEQVQQQQPPAVSDSDLLKEIRSLREEVMTTQALKDREQAHNDTDWSGSRRAEMVVRHPDMPSRTQVAQLRRDISQLNETLLDERELLDCNHSEMGHLSEKVDRLLQPVGRRGQRKTETTSQVEEGEWSLRQQVAALQQDLSKSEMERMQLGRQCELLQGVNDKQTTLREENRLQIQGLEASVLTLGKEKDRMEKKCQHLQDLLQRAEVELSELSAEKARSVAKLESTVVETARLKSKTATLEDRLREVESEREKALAANKRLTAELDQSSSERHRLLREADSLLQRVELLGKSLQEVEGQKSALEAELGSSTSQLKHAKEKATESIKRLKLQCRHNEEELVRLRCERNELVGLHESAMVELNEQRQLLRTSQGVQEHNMTLQERIDGLECQLTQQTVERAQCDSEIDTLRGTKKRQQRNLEKLQCDIVSLEERVQELQAENKKWMLKEKEDHHRSIAEQEEEARELHHHLDRKTEALTQLKKELVTMQSENSSLNGKFTKLRQAYQMLKRELSSCATDKSKGESEVDQLRQQLSMLQETWPQKEQRHEEEIGVMLQQHQQEVMQLREAHNRQLEELRSLVAELQVKLADKESTVRVLRRQQVKALDDHQRFGDSLSRSLEDTEKLRRKYTKARKFYEDKLAVIELEQADSANEENSQLKLDLQETQQTLVRLSNDYELAMKTAHEEIDVLVERVGTRVGIPEFPESVGHEGDLRRWIADVTGKLKWLQTEVERALPPNAKPAVTFR